MNGDMSKSSGTPWSCLSSLRTALPAHAALVFYEVYECTVVHGVFLIASSQPSVHIVLPASMT
jgi:hypothetical protein